MASGPHIYIWSPHITQWLWQPIQVKTLHKYIKGFILLLLVWLFNSLEDTLRLHYKVLFLPSGY